MIQRQAGEIADLHEERGRQSAELDALKAAQSPRAWRRAPWWIWAILGSSHGRRGAAGDGAAKPSGSDDAWAVGLVIVALLVAASVWARLFGLI
jgi:hypothetical protein